MIETLGRAGLTLAEALAEETDLEPVRAALAKETAIRDVMAETGESREVVEEAIGAMDAMAEEGVLDLTEGEPTTLRDALERYVNLLEGRDEMLARDWVLSDLASILAYPWSAEEERLATHGLNDSIMMGISIEDDRDIVIRFGPNGHEVYRGNWEELGSAGQMGVQEAAAAVYRALLVRVIGDRDHHIQLSADELRDLLMWAAERRGGSWVPEHAKRLTVDAVQGGGILVRTRPYSWELGAGRIVEERRRSGRDRS